MALELNYGNAVTGGQRFGRPALEGRLIRALEGGAGVKMFGLRRIGKSTLRLYAMEHFEAARRPYAFVDSQGLQSLGDLLRRLYDAMPGERNVLRQAIGLLTSAPAKAALEAIPKGEKYEAAALSAYWHLVSDAIRAAVGKNGQRPVLVIDEFSYLIDNMIKSDKTKGKQDAEKLLASMREWRGAGMTMLLTGSIGITSLARAHGLNVEHLNDLKPFPIPELTPAEARAFVEAATSGRAGWTAAHTEEFLRQSGVFYPCFLVAGLLEIGVDGATAPEEFGPIFADRIRPDLHADFYHQFDRRFKAYQDLPRGERDKLLLPALKSVMAAPGCAQGAIACGKGFSQVDLSLALTLLAEDGFLHFTEDGEGERQWRPASRLVKLWWKRAGLA